MKQRNLCCVLNSVEIEHVTCNECSQEWCWCEWQEDRTHRGAVDFKKCPKTGKQLEWGSGHNIICAK